MGLHDPFRHLKHKLWSKERSGVKLPVWLPTFKSRELNCQFDSRPLKVGNWPDFLACRWRATYHWKALDEGYNFALDLIAIEGLHAKLWAPKVTTLLQISLQLKVCTRSYGPPKSQLFSDFIAIEGLHAKLWAPKVIILLQTSL
jgi:hypothetical protein